MIIKNQFYDADEDDDRYIKEIGLIQNVLIQKNNFYHPENHPKYIISESQSNYDKLFQLLSQDNPKLIETSWDLLQKLPIYLKLQQEIKELSGVMENPKNWEKILDHKSTNKLLYSLRIINNLFGNPKKDPKSQQWRYKFVSMGGFQHLLRTFVSLEVRQIDTNLTLKCIELLIALLWEFIVAEKELVKFVLESKEAVIMKGIALVDQISDYTLAQEKRRGYCFEDLTKRISLNKQKKNRYKSYMQGNKGTGDNKHQQSQQEEEEDVESQEFSQAQALLKQFNEDGKIVGNLFKFMLFTVI